MLAALGLMLTLALQAVALRQLQVPSRAGLLPFRKIADEIMEAEKTARELTWEVGNSSAEKESVQWFMATAMKELNRMKMVTLNASSIVDGKESLAFRYETCYNNTVARMPDFNDTMSLGENLRADHSAAPDAVEAKMYDVYEAQYTVDQMTTELGECEARCPLDASFLAKKKQQRHAHVVSDVVTASAGAPGAAPGPSSSAGQISQDPRKLMGSIADAIRNTSTSIDQMGTHLHKDRAAMDVLESITATVVEKLLNAKKSVQQMEKDLEDCIKTPAATKLHDEVTDAMTLNPEVTEDMVNAATDRAKESETEVDELRQKLDACKEKCGSL